jgi:hypothetical protein
MSQKQYRPKRLQLKRVKLAAKVASPAHRLAGTDVLDEYVRLLRSGNAPSVDRFVREHGVRPGVQWYALEGAWLLQKAVEDFRKARPGADVAEFFHLTSR